ncbi:MAG: hypothetical protein IJW31_06610 [Lentisphaeria bacterium]|nr:hypothetical protein [Lentisphaeria bacterium]MBR7127246.1 hypothetical protein [Lentisphaeria bacterium]
MKLFGKFLVLLAVMMTSVIVLAEAWDYHGPKRDIVTLIVCANYEQPRLLAELIQYESRQPYLLIPANDQGEIYFCPPKKLGKAKIIPRKSFTRTLSFINPDQIIVLGNNNYVPDYYVKALRKIAPVSVVDAETWQAAADLLAPMLNLSKLPRNYRKLSAKLSEGKFYVPDPRSVNRSAAALEIDSDNTAFDNSSEAVDANGVKDNSADNPPAFNMADEPLLDDEK